MAVRATPTRRTNQSLALFHHPKRPAVRLSMVSMAPSIDQSVMKGRTCSNFEGPIPGTSVNCSMLVKGPFASR